jgi:hypothetical protein
MSSSNCNIRSNFWWKAVIIGLLFLPSSIPDERCSEAASLSRRVRAACH